ncbi:MAG TPA: hypothetical protein GXZ90_09000 [Clostridiales bacterium]|nr:hypothetical protein [Clostridiales bacterium]
MAKSQLKEKIQIHMVITDIGLFITDTLKSEGYDYNYHRSRIEHLYFDGAKPKQAHIKNWFIINKYPEVIQEKQADQKTGGKWVLRDPDMESKALPLEHLYEDLDYEDSVADLYKLEYEVIPGELVDAPCKINVITEVENFRLPPKINYASAKPGDRMKINVDNTDIEHQLLDKLIIPEILMHEYPCKLSSVEMYGIVRQYIKDHINTKYAKITSDYDFCFSVKKIVPVVGPKKINHSELAKGSFIKGDDIKEYREFEIFEMTNEGAKYKGYTPIKGISASNEFKLKEKLDNYLKNLIEFINEPIEKTSKLPVTLNGQRSPHQLTLMSLT